MYPALLLALLTACSPAPRPNVLLITLDTTRFDVIGAYGATDGVTPTLDRLAKEGTRFDRAYTVTPLTIPAHSSIHTGLFPPRHGVRDNGDFFLSEESTTLAERLKGAGYATMASVGAEVTSHHWGFSQGFDNFFDDMGPADPRGNRWRVERSGDKVSADALDWLNQHATATKPWFAWVHYFDAHHPYAPPEPYASKFRPYKGEVAFVDSQVARLVELLENKDILKNTWIFVVADHGEGLGSHGESMHGVLLYDATTHIPFIVRPPSGGQGAEIHSPVSLVDLTPTILSVTGVEQPAGLDGIDLRAIIQGQQSGDTSRAVFAESLYAFHHYHWAPQSALITDTHKLIESTTPELYARDDKMERESLAEQDLPLLLGMEGRLESMVTAMTPANTTTRADMSPERVAQLEALGYLTTSTEQSPTAGLPDPVHQLPVLSKLDIARQAFRDNDMVKAKTAIEAAIAADPGLAETRMLQATLMQREGDLTGAYAVIAALEAAQPGSQTKAMMGSILVLQHQSAEGIQLLAEALQIDPYLSSAWVSYLHALLMTNDPRLLKEAQRARSLLPDLAVAIGMEGVALSMMGRPVEAESLLLHALSLDAHQPFINHALGMVARVKGDALKAEAFFEEEIQQFPPAVPARRALVEMYAEQARFTEQIAQLEAIRLVETPNAETLHSLAQAQFNLKNYTEAAKEVQSCRTLAPNYVGCALLEANVLKKLGRDADAQRAFERAKALAQTPSP